MRKQLLNPELGAELKWNAVADKYNQWTELGQDECDELIEEFITVNTWSKVMKIQKPEIQVVIDSLVAYASNESSYLSSLPCYDELDDRAQGLVASDYVDFNREWNAIECDPEGANTEQHRALDDCLDVWAKRIIARY